jgi:hypothetical protein
VIERKCSVIHLNYTALLILLKKNIIQIGDPNNGSEKKISRERGGGDKIKSTVLTSACTGEVPVV